MSARPHTPRAVQDSGSVFKWKECVVLRICQTKPVPSVSFSKLLARMMRHTTSECVPTCCGMDAVYLHQLHRPHPSSPLIPHLSPPPRPTPLSLPPGLPAPHAHHRQWSHSLHYCSDSENVTAWKECGRSSSSTAAATAAAGRQRQQLQHAVTMR